MLAFQRPNSGKEIINKMDRLEKIANRYRLDEKQTLELNKLYYIYKNLKIKPKSFHETKYKSYNMFYLVNEIKKGKTHLEIMNNIIDECDKYSTAQIIEKHFKNTKN